MIQKLQLQIKVRLQQNIYPFIGNTLPKCMYLFHHCTNLPFLFCVNTTSENQQGVRVNTIKE